MILENGLIRTLDPSLPTARALAVAGDRIVGGVGVHEWALPTPERVDLRGRCVVPGFVDSHVHFLAWALAQQTLRLDDCVDLNELVARVAGAAREIGPGEWLIGRGWREGDWPPGDAPHRDQLDALVPDRPIALVAKDGHSLWLNTSAFEHADESLDQLGAVVERSPDGAPTGILREQAAWRFQERSIQVSDSQAREAMRAAMRVANARGVTAVHDQDESRGILPYWQELRRRGLLSLRVWQSLPVSQLDALAALRLRSGFGDDFLRLGHLKVFMDGALGSGTANLIDGGGIALTDRRELEDLARSAAAAGWPLAIHAIGDQANRDALDALAATEDTWRPLGLRHRVEHAQLVSPADRERFHALGVACSVQFSHAPSDQTIAERDWADRLDGAYAYSSLAAAGALLANGSDAPVEELDPLAGIRAGTSRTLDERPPWRPHEAVTPLQALEATTSAPAWLEGQERVRGRLTPGSIADLVVLSDDPLGDALAEGSLEVVATMVGGRWVHRPPPWG